MDKLLIRKVAAVWAFDENNEAVWKCADVEKLKLSQEGESIRKKDSSGATMFQLDRNKSAKISFEAVIWGFDLISALQGSEKETATEFERINVPFAESFRLTATDIENGYVTLSQRPSENEAERMIAFHKLTGQDTIDKKYRYNSIAASEDMFSYTYLTNRLMLPTDCVEGDFVEAVYEYPSRKATRIVNSADKFPTPWKVRFLVLASEPCNVDKIFAVWISANNAKSAISNDINFELEESLNVTLELGHKFCDNKKTLYEIVVADTEINSGDGVPLETNDGEFILTADDETVNTIY